MTWQFQLSYPHSVHATILLNLCSLLTTEILFSNNIWKNTTDRQTRKNLHTILINENLGIMKSPERFSTKCWMKRVNSPRHDCKQFPKNMQVFGLMRSLQKTLAPFWIVRRWESPWALDSERNCSQSTDASVERSVLAMEFTFSHAKRTMADTSDTTLSMNFYTKPSRQSTWRTSESPAI